ncbi:uncharacterized protein LOC114518565 [Dendronephthya gigantea]|uniref:uncharacterized protein LOC114518565 n=1 Tax=Dendronephthya gigantea TaxID=151771 RepID=UPI00106D3B7C|nr:uncharacterized protein LOC114518565 [Dendronephthya gigantea]
MDTVNPVNHISMHDLRQRTLEKTQYLQENGYNVIEIWTCDIERELSMDSEMKTFFDDFEIFEPLEPRQAFFGGRTNATRLYYDVRVDEKIRYVDFCSFYPWCNKYGEYPIGHPEIITDNFGLVESYFGLIKCSVLPPRGLYHPVLPYRTQGKLMFPLCRTCADSVQQEPCKHVDRERAIHSTWVSLELEKALEKGYRVLKIDEVWHFPEHRDGLFKDYIDTFLKIKQEASGFPAGCDTDEKKSQYIADYAAKEGIQLDPRQIVKNPGLRALAKLMLNSFWGKFAQRPNMGQVKIISDPAEYFDLLSSDKINVTDVNFINDELIEAHYENIEEFVEADGNTNVIIAAFTTAHARLKLYSVLEQLDRRVLYFDTDSVIYVSRDGEWEPPVGSYLGDLTDELDGAHIITFASGGPKNYSYETNKGKTVCKVRGITLNYRTKQFVNHSVLCDLIFLNTISNENDGITIDIPYKIIRDTRDKAIITKSERKKYRMVYTKREL